MIRRVFFSNDFQFSSFIWVARLEADNFLLPPIAFCSWWNQKACQSILINVFYRLDYVVNSEATDDISAIIFWLKKTDYHLDRYKSISECILYLRFQHYVIKDQENPIVHYSDFLPHFVQWQKVVLIGIVLRFCSASWKMQSRTDALTLTHDTLFNIVDYHL